MANVTNQAYYGQAGVLTIGDDTHFGVTTFELVPTTPTEQVVDISGDVQTFTGVPTWVANVVFHQDHVTADSLSRQSHALAGTVVPFTYEPQDGGETASGNLRWVEVPFGGGTGRREVSASFNHVGQPTFTPPA